MGWGREGRSQVKNDKNSDGSRWLQGEGGEDGEGINRNWMSRAIISISVIRIQGVFQTGVWFCFRQHFGFIFSIPSEACLLGFLLQNIEFKSN